MLLSSAIVTLSLLGLASAARVSLDAQCGSSVGRTCLGSTFGNCCSQHGWCGSTTDYCGTGCQSNYGSCTGSSEPSLTTSKTGKCGGTSGFTCLNSAFGSCCSQYNYCGSSSAYCGDGCQSAFGTCNGVSSSSTQRSTLSAATRSSTSIRSSSSTSTSTSAGVSSASPSATQPVSTNARCGPKFGGRTCLGSQWGSCCSKYSYCGRTADYCAPENDCQAGYGECNPVSSSSSMRASTSTRTPSMQSPSYSTTRTQTSISSVTVSTSLLSSSSSVVSSSSQSLTGTTSNVLSSSSQTSSSQSSSLGQSSSSSVSHISTSSVLSSTSTQSISSDSSSISVSSSLQSESTSSQSSLSASLSMITSTAVSASTPSSTCVRELVINGDFETGSLTPWMTYNANPSDSPAFGVESDSTAGGYDFHYSAPQGDYSHIRQTIADLPAGSAVSCSFKYRTSGGFSSLQIDISFNGVYCGISEGAYPSAFQTITGNLVTQSDNPEFLMEWNYGTTSAVDLFIDEVSICLMSSVASPNTISVSQTSSTESASADLTSSTTLEPSSNMPSSTFTSTASTTDSSTVSSSTLSSSMQTSLSTSSLSTSQSSIDSSSTTSSTSSTLSTSSQIPSPTCVPPNYLQALNPDFEAGSSSPWTFPYTGATAGSATGGVQLGSSAQFPAYKGNYAYYVNVAQMTAPGIQGSTSLSYYVQLASIPIPAGTTVNCTAMVKFVENGTPKATYPVNAAMYIDNKVVNNSPSGVVNAAAADWTQIGGLKSGALTGDTHTMIIRFQVYAFQVAGQSLTAAVDNVACYPSTYQC